jgi:hypothetical protein
MRLHASVVMCVIGVGCQNEAPPPPEIVPVARAPVTAKSPARPAAVKAIDRSLGDGLEIRRPIRDGRLAVIPIVATRPIEARPYLTLAAAMQQGVATIREIGRDQNFHVDTLELRNTSDQPLLVLSGELVIEGLQDRVVANDVVIEPGAKQRIGVRCVEHGRTAGDLWFKTGEVMAELSLRERVVHADQATVWQQVDAINRRLSLAPRTQTYREAAELQRTGEAGDRTARLLGQLASLEERTRLVGFAVAIDDQIVAVERYASPELYRALEAELVASYAAGTTGVLPHEAHTLEPTDVRAFLAGRSGYATEASNVVLREM